MPKRSLKAGPVIFVEAVGGVGGGGGGGGRIIIFSFRGAQNLTPGAQWDQSDKDYTNFPTKEKQTEISWEGKI